MDIIASNNCASIKNTAIVLCGIRDGEHIACIRKLNHMKFPEKIIACRDYRSYYPIILSEHLSKVDWNLIYNCHYTNLALRIFIDALSTVFNKFAPVIMRRGECSLWLSVNIKSHMSIRDKHMQKAQKSKVNVHLEECKRKRNEVNIIVQKAKSDYTRTLLSKNSRKPGRLNVYWVAMKCVFLSKVKSMMK